MASASNEDLNQILEGAPLNEADESDLEAARADREGQRWLLEELMEEAPQPSGPPSKRAISQAAFNLLIFFEVTSKAYYEKKYRHPTWPGGSSGGTIGIGYDVGYATKAMLHADWDPALVATLEPLLGVTGESARALAQSLSAFDAPWTAAIEVHRNRVLPRWTGIVERSLKNTDLLSDDSLGALVSLVYNRGASFTLTGDRFAEMRHIAAHMAEKQFGLIPADLRSMKRLWPDSKGLRDRREREARLFEQGLAQA